MSSDDGSLSDDLLSDGPLSDGAVSSDSAVGAQVRVFVQTRGTARATDYAFLGGAPPKPWWRAYRDATAFDHPTVLVTSDGARWAAYLSGIPSTRIDAVGTVVRYTLVLDGPCGAAEAPCVTAAVAAWVDDVADHIIGGGARPAGAGGGTRSGRLSAALDAQFPLDDVQRWLATDERHSRRTGSDDSAVRQSASAPVDVEVRRRALAALGALSTPVPALDEPGDWMGAVTGLGPRATFVARVDALVGGAPGRALLLNLVGGPDDAAALLDPERPTAVLVEGAAPARVTPLRSEVDAKKAPAATASPPRTALAGAATLPVLTVAVLVAVVVVVLMTLVL